MGIRFNFINGSKFKWFRGEFCIRLYGVWNGPFPHPNSRWHNGHVSLKRYTPVSTVREENNVHKDVQYVLSCGRRLWNWILPYLLKSCTQFPLYSNELIQNCQKNNYFRYEISVYNAHKNLLTSNNKLVVSFDLQRNNYRCAHIRGSRPKTARIRNAGEVMLTRNESIIKLAQQN